MHTHAMANRRTYPRYRGRVRVQYAVPEAPLKIAFTGDVGPSGCHVVTASPVLPGSRVDLEISLPGGVLVRVRGVVRWAKKVPARLSRLGHGGFGVEFEEVPEPWFKYCLEMQDRAKRLAGQAGGVGDSKTR